MLWRNFMSAGTRLLLLGLFFTFSGQGFGAQAQAESLDVKAKLQWLQEEVSEKGFNFLVGYNPAMDYPLEQLCGLVEPANWKEKARFSGPMPKLSLPSRFDWREHAALPPVKNQANCGSCWAFATVGVLESLLKIRMDLLEDISEQYLVSCNIHGWSCSGGWFAHDYHEDLTPPGEPTAGAVLETNFPYAARNLPCGAPHAHAYRLAEWRYVGAWWNVPTVEEIKQAIYTHGPVAAAVAVGPAFQAYRDGVFDKDESSVGVNHAIVLVGWDDQYYWNGSTHGVWILRNSWGSGWGKGGYMLIKYNTSQVGYAANYAQLVQYTVSPPQGTMGTQITVLGSEFGDRSPKVYTQFQDPKTGEWRRKDLVLEYYSPTAIEALWTAKLPPGSYPVMVQSGSGQGGSPVEVGRFLVKEPEIESLMPEQGTAASTVEIRGAFFGKRKPIVRLTPVSGGRQKRCKILSHFMDPVTGSSLVQCKIPRVPEGAYVLELNNSIGEAAKEFTVVPSP
ncbi:MAG: C1 family peptidase [bacterium]